MLCKQVLHSFLHQDYVFIHLLSDWTETLQKRGVNLLQILPAFLFQIAGGFLLQIPTPDLFAFCKVHPTPANTPTHSPTLNLSFFFFRFS